MVALRTSSTQVYVGWRLLGNDPGDVGFNLYRSANGGAAVKVNSATLTNTTDYVDAPANLSTTAYTYSVKPVLNGVEVADIWANPLSPPAVLPLGEEHPVGRGARPVIEPVGHRPRIGRERLRRAHEHRAVRTALDAHMRRAESQRDFHGRFPPSQ